MLFIIPLMLDMKKMVLDNVLRFLGTAWAVQGLERDGFEKGQTFSFGISDRS